jgi:hypothetical protein
MINPTASGLRENIFAFGDVCLTSLNELKTIPAIKLMSDYLVQNLLSLARDGKPVVQLPS